MRCPACGFQPIDPTDKARALLLSSQHLDESSLKEAEQALSEHRPWSYDERQVADLAQRIRLDPAPVVSTVLLRWFLCAAAVIFFSWLATRGTAG